MDSEEEFPIYLRYEKNKKKVRLEEAVNILEVLESLFYKWEMDLEKLRKEVKSG